MFSANTDKYPQGCRYTVPRTSIAEHFLFSKSVQMMKPTITKDRRYNLKNID
jgi:hypothetical protein